MVFSDFERFFGGFPGFLSVFCGLMGLKDIPNHPGGIRLYRSGQTTLLTLFWNEKPLKTAENRRKTVEKPTRISGIKLRNFFIFRSFAGNEFLELYIEKASLRVSL